MKQSVELRRQLSKVSVTNSDQRLLGPNPRRIGLICSPPPGIEDTRIINNQVVHNASTATTGVKLTYTVPAGKQAFIHAFAFFETVGTGVVAAAQVIVGGATITLTQGTTALFSNGDFWLSAGDTFQWNVTTLIAASTADFSVMVQEYTLASRVTLSLDGAAVLDQGININPGTPPFVLWEDHIGQAIREEIRGIAAQGTIPFTLCEIFEVGCPCMAKEGY